METGAEINIFFVYEMYLTIVAILLALFFVTMNITRESFTSEEKKTCRTMAKKSEWKNYKWQPRQQFGNEWACPPGWEDTKCNWGMGKEFENRQCRRANKHYGGKECLMDWDCVKGEECNLWFNDKGVTRPKCVPIPSCRWCDS